MLKSLALTNFTAFGSEEFEFSPGLNVIVGANGTGKTHIMKLAYSILDVSSRGGKETGADTPTKVYLQKAMARELSDVFKPDELGRLARRSRQGKQRCEVRSTFTESSLNMTFSFNTASKSDVVIDDAPSAWLDGIPVFLPTRELLTIYPGFVSLYETTHLPFEKTWRDTCILLGAPLARGPRERQIKRLLGPLERAMGGRVVLEESGRFYLAFGQVHMEMHLVAEGLRKLATIARLIATGSLLDKGYLFWDEPESNLNPKLIKAVARAILQIAESGIQVFIATHSLFLMRELHILHQREFNRLDTRCFGLHVDADNELALDQGKTMDDIGDITALDEDLKQSERYIDTEMGIGVAPNDGPAVV